MAGDPGEDGATHHPERYSANMGEKSQGGFQSNKIISRKPQGWPLNRIQEHYADKSCIGIERGLEGAKVDV